MLTDSVNCKFVMLNFLYELTVFVGLGFLAAACIVLYSDEL